MYNCISISNSFNESWTYGTEVLGKCVPRGARIVTGSFTVPYEEWVRTE